MYLNHSSADFTIFWMEALLQVWVWVARRLESQKRQKKTWAWVDGHSMTRIGSHEVSLSPKAQLNPTDSAKVAVHSAQRASESSFCFVAAHLSPTSSFGLSLWSERQRLNHVDFILWALQLTDCHREYATLISPNGSTSLFPYSEFMNQFYSWVSQDFER